MPYRKIFFTFLSLMLVVRIAAQDVLTVNTRQIKAKISPTLWGLFFEDINRGADGGLYAEMVENTSFDFPKPLMGWATQPARVRTGIFMVINQSGMNVADPKYLQVNLSAGDKVGLVNEGFGGMGFKKGTRYEGMVRYRRGGGGANVAGVGGGVAAGPRVGNDVRMSAVGADARMSAVSVGVSAQLLNSKGAGIGEATIDLSAMDTAWHEQHFSIIAADTASQGKLLLRFEGSGQLEIDRVSLFPGDTWKGRPGGLRTDLAQKLADLHPGFLRFPGGCIVEGKDIVHRYQWKKTIGPLEDRQLIMSIWNDDVPLRQTPDYFESFGLGFYEYFQLCEDIGAAPLPIINCGLSCQFDAAEVVPLSELDPYVRDALDLIEFANGDATTTTWGARRAALGHAAPFNLKLLGVGNENWGPQYAERLAVFTKAIKNRYPYMQLICSSGYTPQKQEFQYIDSVLRSRHVDIIDEHFYNSPEWFLQNATRYDKYDRQGPKIFVGEYAAQSDRIGSLKNENNLRTALTEAAFMTGIERNADVVTMASYAPLFAHVTGWQWTPDLIWFDNTRSYATPNYYVQQLFSVNKGTAVVDLFDRGAPLTGQDSCWGTACLDEPAGELILKLVNLSDKAKQKTIAVTGRRLGRSATVTTLAGTAPGGMNSLEHPDVVAPVIKEMKVAGKGVRVELPAYSCVVVRVGI
ncbi:MAG TPA: alpha-L-arabinofuranosidase C-terminal domain-containing protein [Puia sp.]|nr:alpha-L-arabinofuranosidase C-terminal domain-containing protein [Puia sp.]